MVHVKARLTPLSKWPGRRQYHEEMNKRLAQIVADTALARRDAGLAPAPPTAKGRTKQWDHVPSDLKHSTCKTFKAKGLGAKAVLSEAYKARRTAINGGILAAQTLVKRGAPAQLAEEVQWHPFVVEALEDEDFIEASFMTAVHGLEALPLS